MTINHNAIPPAFFRMTLEQQHPAGAKITSRIPAEREEQQNAGARGAGGPDRPFNPTAEKALKRLGIEECSACKQRRYQDRSNDPGVSYQFPTPISPEKAYIQVLAHEREHLTRNRDQAVREDKKIVYQSVRLLTAVCPECGRVYVAGGRATTVTKKESSPDTPGTKTRGTGAPASLIDFYA